MLPIGNQLPGSGVEPEQRHLGVGNILPVARGHEHTGRAAHIAQVDIVQPGRRGGMEPLALQVIDMDRRLLVGRNHKTCRRVSRIAPDGGIVGGIVGRSDRIGLDRGGDRRGGQRAHHRLRRGGATGEKQGPQDKDSAHQKLTRMPPE